MNSSPMTVRTTSEHLQTTQGDTPNMAASTGNDKGHKASSIVPLELGSIAIVPATIEPESNHTAQSLAPNMGSSFLQTSLSETKVTNPYPVSSQVDPDLIDAIFNDANSMLEVVYPARGLLFEPPNETHMGVAPLSSDATGSEEDKNGYQFDLSHPMDQNKYGDPNRPFFYQHAEVAKLQSKPTNPKIPGSVITITTAPLDEDGPRRSKTRFAQCAKYDERVAKRQCSATWAKRRGDKIEYQAAIKERGGLIATFQACVGPRMKRSYIQSMGGCLE